MAGFRQIRRRRNNVLVISRIHALSVQKTRKHFYRGYRLYGYPSCFDGWRARLLEVALIAEKGLPATRLAFQRLGSFPRAAPRSLLS